MDDQKLEFDIYEVFAQTDPMGHHEHQFSLLASTPDMALTLAQENFLRRADVISIWVAPRDQITKSTPEQRAQFVRLDKSYRMKQSYSDLAEKWRKYKSHPLLPLPSSASTAEEPVGKSGSHAD